MSIKLPANVELRANVLAHERLQNSEAVNRVLGAIYQDHTGPVSTAEIVEATGVDRKYVGVILSRLAKKGLVVKVWRGVWTVAPHYQP